MKFFIVALALVAVAAAQTHQPVVILRQSQEASPDGSYNFNYETENGISHSETGTPVTVQPDGHQVVVASGQYQYTAPDGTPIVVSYVADANGYHPEGDHIPKTPVLIQRALDYVAAHPPKVEDQ